MANQKENYFVVRSFGIYLLDRVPEGFRLDDYPSCIWLGGNPKEGQRVADQYNVQLIGQGKLTAERAAKMRGSRIREEL